MKRIRKGALGAGIVGVMAISLALPAGASANLFTVATATDAHDPTPANATCDAPCSLRGAIETASNAANPGDDTVAVPVALGPYSISLGELQAIGNGPLTIQGTGTGRAVIDANLSSRVLETLTTALTLQKVTLREGKTTGSAHGAGLAFSSSAAAQTLTLDDSSIQANQARGSDSAIPANDNIDAFGGGIFANLSAAGTQVTILNSDITTNQAGNGSSSNGTGGGIAVFGDDPKLTLTGSNVNTNTATGEDGADTQLSSLGGSAGGIYFSDSDNDTTVGTLTLTNSQINSNVAGPGTNPVGVNNGLSLSYGGAIQLVGIQTAPALTANGGSIDNNTAGGGTLDRRGIGGGIASTEGDANSDVKLGTTTPLTMTGNKAGGGMGTGQGDGGAIYSLNDVSVKDSVLTQNMAGVGTPGGLGVGGAIDVDVDIADYLQPSVSVDGSDVSQNVAAGAFGAGGALALTTTRGNLNVTDSLLDSNQAATSTNGGGGAIFRATELNQTTIVDKITDTTISNDSTQGRGGAIQLFSDGTFHIERSTLYGNTASAAGGAIDANSATSANPLGNLELINSTLTQNTAAQGGAINADAGSSPINLALFLTTVAGNTAPSASNIRYLGNMTTPPTLTMAGAIVALPNGGGQNCAAIPAGTVNFDNRGGNLTDGSSGPGLSCSIGSGTNDTSGTNPMLGPLVNNGGPTLTMAIQQQGTVKSQAFNRVPALVCAGFTTDQRGTGFTRPQGGACDSGAFEARLFTLTVTPAGAGTGTVTGAGISCGSDCSESYLEGTSVPLTATPAGDSSFAGYSGSCSGATCTLAMSQNRAVTATFDLLPVDQTQPITQPPTSPGTTIPAPPCRPGFKLKTVKKHGKKRKRCVKKKKKKKK